MSERLFERMEHAYKYAQFRPPPPASITENILKFIQEKVSPPYDYVVDVGCGTGQSTRIWCPHFRNVMGCDISSAQISFARKESKDNSNVSYVVCPSHNIPLSDHSVDLISTVASLHWFDIPKFLQEAKRLLKPNGVLAVQGYNKPILLFDTDTKNDAAKALIGKLLGEELGNYWSPKVEMIVRQFSDVSFPFDQVVRCNNIRSEFEATVGDVIGYVTSFSCYQSMKEKEPDRLENIMKDFTARLLDLAGGENSVFTFARDNFLILCRD